MDAVTVTCSRCGSEVHGTESEEATSGFYRVLVGPWEEYGEPGEYVLCDACMLSDPRYQARYGTPRAAGEVLRLQHIAPTARLIPGQHEFAPSTVEIPDFTLPRGYSKERTLLTFEVPAGYPFAKPEHFYVDEDVQMASGAPPNWTSREHGRRKWYLRPQQWNPSRYKGGDDLTTFLRLIRIALRHQVDGTGESARRTYFTNW